MILLQLPQSSLIAVAYLKYLRQIYLLLLFISLPYFMWAQYSSPTEEDVAQSQLLARKYKDEGIVCRSSYHYFTFDKGKNELNDKVVTIQEDAELEFLSIKKFTSLTYPEFYNKFIHLKTFKKAIKYGNKYITLEKSGIDRSVTNDDIFFDDSRVQYFPLQFSQQGAVARITVKKQYSDGKYLTRIFFHEPYPVLEQAFEFKVPDWLTINFKPVNFDGYKIEKKQTSKGGYTNYVFIMKDVPAAKQEFKQLGRAYTDPHIIIQIRSFESRGETFQGFDKTDDVYKWNNRLYNMAGNDQQKIKETLSKITSGMTTDIDKIKAIYYFVQDKIRYLAFEEGYSGYIPSSAQDVLTNKYGDCKGMANLLTEMLKLAGYYAHFTWIGTRAIPYPQSIPALCVNNHAITTLYYQNKPYFLDATEKYVPFGENAYRIQGKEAMVSKGDKFELLTVPVTTSDEHKIFTKADFTLKNDQLTGVVQVTLTGNERKDFHQYYHQLSLNSKEEFLNNYLEFNNNNLEASEVKTSNLDNRESPVVITGKINLSNQVQTIGNDKYINLDFFPKTLDRYMPDEKRVNGYDFDYVLCYQDEYSLTIPQGHQFADVPEKLDIKSDGFEFTGEYIVMGNKIVLKKNLSLKKSIINKKDFTDWSNFLSSIKEFSRYFFSVTQK